MDLSLGHYPILVSLGCIAAVWAFVRPKRTVRDRALDEALRRIRAGEEGVRLEPGQWGTEARSVSRINAALAAIEGGAPRTDPEIEASPIFRALRDEVRAVHAGDVKTYVAVVEVDRFATLRQSIGYRLANGVLATLAERIRATIDTAEIGRIGRATIEFAFKAASHGEAQLKLLDAIEALEQRLMIDRYNFDLTVVIGFADAGGSSIRDELADRAAAALSAGQAERVKVCFATEAVLARSGHADLELMRELAGALKSGEIELHYQPKLEARTNRVKAAEALVRWHHPRRGLVPTDSFIKLAEETGAVRDLTDWVIARAVRDQARLAAEGHDVEIFVNISGQLLPDADFARVALELAGPARGRIGFEITETAVIGDPEAALANLRAFTDAGIRIAIDDYGSGLSSLAYLKQLPAHELKIDRLFVSGLTDSHRDPLIIRSSIDLAHALEMEVTAEGVDDAMALSLLRVMGCDLLQGYFISPPVPMAEFLVFLNDDEQLDRLSAEPRLGGDWARFGTA
jgi:EAL domain-containing protein (putative c-di-GMP-specific phosphodiesterase class I)/GGDEF domain-containing protein